MEHRGKTGPEVFDEVNGCGVVGWMCEVEMGGCT